LRTAPPHIARTTSFRVVRLALEIARIRSSGQSSAANRRDPVMFTLNIDFGA
jgi:hypothetical protein